MPTSNTVIGVTEFILKISTDRLPRYTGCPAKKYKTVCVPVLSERNTTFWQTFMRYGSSLETMDTTIYDQFDSKHIQSKVCNCTGSVFPPVRSPVRAARYWMTWVQTSASVLWDVCRLLWYLMFMHYPTCFCPLFIKLFVLIWVVRGNCVGLSSLA